MTEALKVSIEKEAEDGAIKASDGDCQKDNHSHDCPCSSYEQGYIDAATKYAGAEYRDSMGVDFDFADWVAKKNTDETTLRKISGTWYWSVNKHGNTKYTDAELYEIYQQQKPLPAKPKQ